MGIIWFVCYCTFAQGQEPPKVITVDTAVITVRTLPDSTLDTYKQYDEFIYATGQEEGISLWDRFWRWFWRWVDKMYQRKGMETGTRVFIYGLAFALIAYAVYKFSGMDRRSLFRSNTSEDISFREATENIYEMDLPAAIRQAESEGNYRLALRLQYLSSLRKLADKKLITYTIHKTNHDYAMELNGTPYAASFSRVTLLYEFGWYGEFEITDDIYARIRAIFDEHFQQLAV